MTTDLVTKNAQEAVMGVSRWAMTCSSRPASACYHSFLLFLLQCGTTLGQVPTRASSFRSPSDRDSVCACAEKGVNAGAAGLSFVCLCSRIELRRYGHP